MFCSSKEVFSKVWATSLPPHRSSLPLISSPGLHPLRAAFYSQSALERETITEYIQSSLAAGIIHPFSSPTGAGFYFLDEDKTLHPCIDYRGLNDITVKNPLPFIYSAFELLQGASIFTKLDCRRMRRIMCSRFSGGCWRTSFLSKQRNVNSTNRLSPSRASCLVVTSRWILPRLVWSD